MECHAVNVDLCQHLDDTLARLEGAVAEMTLVMPYLKAVGERAADIATTGGEV